MNSAAEHEWTELTPLDRAYPYWGLHASIISRILEEQNIEESLAVAFMWSEIVILAVLIWLVFFESRKADRKVVITLIVAAFGYFMIAYVSLKFFEIRVWIVVPWIIIGSSFLLTRWFLYANAAVRKPAGEETIIQDKEDLLQSRPKKSDEKETRIQSTSWIDQVLFTVGVVLIVVSLNNRTIAVFALLVAVVIPLVRYFVTRRRNEIKTKMDKLVCGEAFFKIRLVISVFVLLVGLTSIITKLSVTEVSAKIVFVGGRQNVKVVNLIIEKDDKLRRGEELVVIGERKLVEDSEILEGEPIGLLKITQITGNHCVAELKKVHINAQKNERMRIRKGLSTHKLVAPLIPFCA